MKSVLEFDGNSNTETIDLLEEAIRNCAREVIESFYKAEVQSFINSTASLVGKKGHRLVVRNGWHKERTILTTSGYATVRLRHNSAKVAVELLPRLNHFV